MTKIAQIFFLWLIIFCLCFDLDAQTGDWIRLQSDNGEFSAQLPPNFTYFYDKEGFNFSKPGFDAKYAPTQILWASDGATVMSIESYRTSSPRELMDWLIEKSRLNLSKVSSAKDFRLKEAKLTEWNNYNRQTPVPISFVYRVIASKNYVYVISAGNRGTPSPQFERFLSSIRLEQNQLGNQSFSSLKPLTVQDLIQPVTNPQKTITFEIQKDPQNPKPDLGAIIILVRPLPAFTDSARSKLTSGNIKLRALFNKTGAVSRINFVEVLPDGLNRNAFFSALRMKFLPQEENNQPVSVSKQIEYSFSIY